MMIDFHPLVCRASGFHDRRQFCRWTCEHFSKIPAHARIMGELIAGPETRIPVQHSTGNQRKIMTAKSILIVEDEGLIALHLIEILTNAGYRVLDPVASGEEALRYLEKIPPPDLVLMDITLDGPLDGIETARLIRRKYSVPVVFLSAHSNGHIMARAQEVSPHGYIVKPVMEKDLLENIGRVLLA
jgi:CheY-like chemotaxis protein